MPAQHILWLRDPAKNVSRIRPGGTIMPIVRVEMWPGRTAAQKRELARVITDAMVNIAQTTADATIVIFEDIARDDWAQGGKLASEAD
jgi:4-oxalocrotonate tautomerase